MFGQSTEVVRIVGIMRGFRNRYCIDKRYAEGGKTVCRVNGFSSAA